MAQLRLNLKRLAEKRGLSLRAISRRGDASWPTVHKYIAQPERVQHLSLDSFGAVLEGLGLDPDEIAELQLGDVFDVSADGEEES